MNSHERVLRLVEDERWAILPSKLEQICEVVRLWASGADISPFKSNDHPEPFSLSQPQTETQSGAIAVLPLFGMISRRANMMTNFSGGTSIAKFTDQFRQAMADPEVSAIVMDIDSPGGGVFGVPELAAEIFQARKKKPIVAIANPIAASAALWIGSAASEFVVSPSGQAGSIGVYATHMDISKANQMMGVKPTYISAGKFKVEGNPDQPLSDEARDFIQADVDRYYSMFTGAVARYRRVKRDEVVNGFGQGRMLGSNDAVKEGMADWVGTFDDVVARVAAGEVGSGKRAAVLEEGVKFDTVALPTSAEVVLLEAEEAARVFWTRARYEE